jgi:putative hydrolase of the HAD superfamily
MAAIPAAAVLFDLGNTLVAYYTGAEFPSVLRRCLRACADALGLADGSWDPEAVFRDAMRMNAGRPDFAVRLLDDRLKELFGPHRAMDERVLEKVCDAFLHPIFELARVDAEAIPLLEALRQRGIKTAIVSNTPWGSPASRWRDEVARHGLRAKVDAAVFCVDVGWRKPHAAPFRRALELLAIAPSDAIFVGDDPRWDVVGARNAGIRPVLLDPSATVADPDCERIRRLTDVLGLVGVAAG